MRQIKGHKVVDIEGLEKVICRVGKIKSIADDDVLGEAGFSSMYVLELLMELEDEYKVQIPDEQFIAARTPRDIYQMLLGLKKEE